MSKSYCNERGFYTLVLYPYPSSKQIPTANVTRLARLTKFCLRLLEILSPIARLPAEILSPIARNFVSDCSAASRAVLNLVPRACDPWEGNKGSGIIRCRKPGILAKIELRIHFNGQSDSSLKRIIPEPSFPSQGS